jgi:hypothetical protein
MNHPIERFPRPGFDHLAHLSIGIKKIDNYLCQTQNPFSLLHTLLPSKMDTSSSHELKEDHLSPTQEQKKLKRHWKANQSLVVAKPGST